MEHRHHESAPTPAFNDKYKVETYRDSKGEHRFRVVSKANSQVVAAGESYIREKDMLSTVSRLFPDAEIQKVEE